MEFQRQENGLPKRLRGHLVQQQPDEGKPPTITMDGAVVMTPVIQILGDGTRSPRWGRVTPTTPPAGDTSPSDGGDDEAFNDALRHRQMVDEMSEQGPPACS
jgi:hypothetical protein